MGGAAGHGRSNVRMTGKQGSARRAQSLVARGRRGALSRSRMPRVTLLKTLSFCALGALAGIAAETPPPPAFHDWAPTPPMGWNSWDCFATTVTEAQTREQADFMAAKLRAHGWQYVVVDIQWYEPAANSFDYRKDAVLVMDEWGRLLPATNRFPSAANGAGFKPLADYVHSLGLKFGIHLMRGIPRQAVEKNLPVLGAHGVRAADIADKDRICPWNPDMYGVEMTKPGAQAYYDSVFALIASWGVDYVKVDDLSRPYFANQREVEAVRAAIDHSGRPMVLSLSPGETDLAAAEHVKQHANLWRISDDFWDSWPALHEQFARLKNWNPHRGAGFWPDADMLPLGVLEMGKRTTNFTRAEQFTLMTLWSIARSPLMHGGDLTKTDDFTLSLLANDEVLAVNQHSTNNRPLFDRDNLIGWLADVPGSPDRYLALFNARDRLDLAPARAAWRSGVVNRQTPGQGVPFDVSIQDATKLVLVVDPSDRDNRWDHGDWCDVVLVAADGTEKKLTDLEWANASAGSGKVAKGRGASGEPLRVSGRVVADGIGTHAKSVIEYALPPGFVRVKGFAGLDDAAMPRPYGGTLEFQIFAVTTKDLGPEEGLPVEVTLAEAGFGGPVRVRDLWQQRDVGEFAQQFAPLLPWHGAGLYRLSPVAKTK